MTLNTLAIQLYNATGFLGLHKGFWLGMAVCISVVLIMNIVFWTMKPKSETTSDNSFINNQKDETERL